MQRDVCGCIFTLAHIRDHLSNASVSRVARPPAVIPEAVDEGVSVGRADAADVFFMQAI